MATCKDCIHWAVCGRREKSISLDPMKSGYKCPDFKNKADVQEVKHGEQLSNAVSDDYVCSECGGIAPVDCEKEDFYESNYCLNCGARMDGDNNA